MREERFFGFGVFADEFQLEILGGVRFQRFGRGERVRSICDCQSFPDLRFLSYGRDVV